MEFRTNLTETTKKMSAYLDKAERTEAALLHFLELKAAYLEKQLSGFPVQKKRKGNDRSAL